LRSVLIERGALDVALVRDGHDHHLFRNKVFGNEVADLFVADDRAAIVTVGFDHLAQVLTHQSVEHFFVPKDGLVVGDLVGHFLVLGVQLLDFEASQGRQAHAQNGTRLYV
jgi:hypothetical protein